MLKQRKGQLRLFVTATVLSGLVPGISWLGRELIYSPTVCCHEAERPLHGNYRKDIDSQALSAPLKVLLDDAQSGKLVGRCIDEVEGFPLAQDRRLTEEGAVFLFLIPCCHTTVPHDHELWLSVEVNYQCNHVINCSMYDELIPPSFWTPR